MVRLALLLSLLMLLSTPAETLAQEQPTGTPSPTPSVNEITQIPTATQFVSIESPQSGQAIQGSVPILGSLPATGISSAELLFSYAENTTGTWFLIQDISGIPESSPLAQWDTTTISDDTYTLRLVVQLVDGNEIEQRVTGLRVRNYSPIETETPTPVTPTLVPVLAGTPSATFTPTLLSPTATPFPPNPAQLTPVQYRQGFGKGVLLVFGFFALLGLYWIIRGRRR